MFNSSLPFRGGGRRRLAEASQLSIRAVLSQAWGPTAASRSRSPFRAGFWTTALLLAATAMPAHAQEMDPNMPGMDHGAMEPVPEGDKGDFFPTEPIRASNAQGSGTSRLPGNEGAMHGLHLMPGGDWMVMIHGSAAAQYSKATGPRGDDKLYATSMAMVMAEKDTGWGRIQLKSMMSLEPLMRHDGYPNLFATGEEAYGNPIVDRQHPHDLFMELAGRVDVNVSENTRVFVYGGPVGEPALGPSAFMHRRSARFNPEAPITHHWFDSTHITYGVVTLGASTPKLQLETSLFTGREPDEHRWNIEKPRFDSWSVRATWTPTPDWALQASHGILKQPEASHPGENERRTTASVHYANDGLSAMAGVSAKTHSAGETSTAWIAEANWDLGAHHSLFGRFENVENSELFPNPLAPLHDTPFRVSKLQAGYAYRLPLGDSPFSLALGGSLATFFKPSALDAAYGNHPLGYTLFLKLSLGD
ncbi:MAG: hypothetical protein RIS52_2031 [Pseudomonadota bacterium]